MNVSVPRIENEDAEDMLGAAEPGRAVSQVGIEGRVEVAELRLERQELIARLAVLDSTLRQREEEIEQTRRELADVSALLKQQEELATDRLAMLDATQDGLSTLQGKLQDANDWVFKLAGQRQAAEAKAAALQREMTSLNDQRIRSERKIGQIEEALTNVRTEKADLLGELENLSEQVRSAHLDLRQAEEDGYALRQSHAAHVDNLQKDHSTAFASVMARLGDAQGRLDSLQERAFEQTRELSALTALLLETEAALSQGEAQQASLLEQNMVLVRNLDEAVRQLDEVRDTLHHAQRENDALLCAHAGQVATIEQGHAQALSDTIEQLKSANHRIQESDGQIGEKTRELSSLSLLLVDAEQSLDAKSSSLDWLVQISAEMRRIPIWWHLIPATWRARRINDRLLARNLFDAQSYLALYPDVAAAGADPLCHFLNHGMGEGRMLTR